MKLRRKSYTGYSIGCAVVWAILWAVVAPTANESTREKIQTVAIGWVLGWLSATIARYVYPPPRKWMHAVDVSPHPLADRQ